MDRDQSQSLEMLPIRPLTSKPLVLIKVEDDRLIPVEETINWLKEQTKAVSVASIIGPTGLGKSYLMNCFMNNNGSTGFPSDNNIDGTTRGIWVWGLEHPSRSNEIVLLIDTEGQLDVERTEVQDTKIALLTLLLSSVIMFNVSRKIGSDLIQQIACLAYYAQQIHFDIEGASGEQTHISEHLPSLVVLIRDFQSRLQFQGRHVTPDSYLESCLHESIRTGDWNRKVDPMRRIINEMFPRKKRFGRILPNPFAIHGNVVNLPEGVPSFEAGLEELKHLILCLCQPKTLSNNDVMNGRYFANLIETYVNILNEGEAINIQPTLTLISKQETQRLIEEGMDIYTDEMTKLNYPMDNDQLYAEHSRITSVVIQELLPKIVFDNVTSFSSRLQTSFRDFFNLMTARNGEESVKKCKDHLQELHGKISQRVSSKDYFCPNGYEQYKKDMEQLVTEYQRIPNKGPKSDETLLQFISEKEIERNLVLKGDTQMTELKIKEEANRIKEEQLRILEEQSRKERQEMNQRMEDLIKQNEAMQKQFEEEHKQRMRRLEEQLEEQRERMEEYRRQMEARSNSPWNQLLEVVTTVLRVLPVGRMFQRRLQ